MKQNLGKLDRIFRFAVAFWWLGPFAPHFSVIWVDWLLFVVAWLALFESFLGYCYGHELLGIKNTNQ